MSIAIATYAPGAIASYSDFVTELRDMLDDNDYAQDAIDRALRKAEAEFNRTLRTPDMENRIVLSVTTELTLLPSDFLEMRSVFQEGSPDATLASMSPHAIVAAYRGYAGSPVAYAIEGGMIRVAPVGSAALDLTYYAAIPQLSDAQVSNWLLRKHPDLYVAGALYHLARRERDNDGMEQAAQEVQTLTTAIMSAGQRARWGAAPLTPAGIQQVRGVRA
ncbi:MAG: phage adaptor protein [Polynucleobacter sp.]